MSTTSLPRELRPGLSNRVGHFLRTRESGEGRALALSRRIGGAGRRSDRDPRRRAERIADRAARFDRRRRPEPTTVSRRRSPSRGAPRSARGALRRCSAPAVPGGAGGHASFGRWRPEGTVVLTGGMVHNSDYVHGVWSELLASESRLSLLISPEAVFAGAYGAAILGGPSVRTDRAPVGASLHRATGLGTGRAQGPLAELTRPAVCFSRQTGQSRRRRRGSRPP